MRRPQVSIRLLIVILAVSGCLEGVGILISKSGRYDALAARQTVSVASALAHVNRMAALLNTLEADIAKKNGKEDPEIYQLMLREKQEVADDLRRETLNADRETAILRSYQRVARYPWLSAPPEPPELK